MDSVYVLVNKLFLNGSVVPLNKGVNLRTPWIDKQVSYVYVISNSVIDEFLGEIKRISEAFSSQFNLVYS